MSKISFQNLSKSKKIAFVVLCVALVLLIGFLILRAYMQKQIADRKAAAEANYQEIKEELTEVDDTFSKLFPEFPTVDFESLQEVNSDVVAWIEVPGTDVAYPVLQNQNTEDPYDSYYLETTIDGVSGLPGSIYMEPCNSKDFLDFNTVIYGHNMRNGSMFTTLHNYEEEGYMEENPYIYIVTPNRKMVYEVDAVVFYDDRHIMANYAEDGDAFLKTLKENGDSRDQFREGVELSTDTDMIVTLSTCTSGASTERYLIVGRLIHEVYMGEK